MTNLIPRVPDDYCADCDRETRHCRCDIELRETIARFDQAHNLQSWERDWYEARD